MGVRVVNPRGIYEPSTYFQASVSSGSQIICLAGQVAVDAQGNLVGGKDLAAQTEQAFRNVHIALSNLGATFADVAKLTVYVVDWNPNKMDLLLAGAKKAAEALRFDLRRPVTLVGVDSLASPEWLVEVEAFAVIS